MQIAEERLEIRELNCENDLGFPARWNQFVAEAEYGHLQQGYENALLKSRLGWQPRFFRVECDGEIQAGALLLLRHLPGRLCSVAVIPCGPIWRRGRDTLVPAVLSAVSEYCRRHRTIFCRMYPTCTSETFDQIVRATAQRKRVLRSFWSYWNQPRVRMIVDIQGDPLNQISSDIRTKARRAERNSVHLRPAGVEIVPALANLMLQMADRKRVLVRNQEYFRSLFEVYRDNIFSIVAEVGRETIAASLVVVLGSVAYELYRAFDYSKRRLRPNEALQVALMEWAKMRGCSYYDMGGTCTNWPVHTSDKGYGVYKFKERLGAKCVVSPPYVDLIYSLLLYKGSFLVENVGLPLVLEKGLGKFQVALDRIHENL